MCRRRIKPIEFNTDAFRGLVDNARMQGVDPRRDGWSFVISLDNAVAFYKFAEGEIAAGRAERSPPSRDRTASDVAVFLYGIPVRIRASMIPVDGVWILSPEKLADFDRAELVMSTRRRRGYPWS